eukprot:5051970-Heterocapsa_arctica.AAC.1
MTERMMGTAFMFNWMSRRGFSSAERPKFLRCSLAPPSEPTVACGRWMSELTQKGDAQTTRRREG